MIKHISGKNSRYASVFMDFDGTIADTCEGILNAVKHMFAKIGMDINDEKSLYAFIGPPVKHHLMDAYGFSEEQAAGAYAYFTEYYREKGLMQSRLFPGIEETLRHIKASEKTLYIATSKPRPMVMKLVDAFDIARYFDGVYCADHGKGIYSKTQVLQNAFRDLGGKPESAVMVGDRYHDIEGAKAVGIDSVGVLYGYGGYDELVQAGCDYIAETMRDLAVLLGGKE